MADANRRMNLTRLTEPRDFYLKHVLDSWMPFPFRPLPEAIYSALRIMRRVIPWLEMIRAFRCKDTEARCKDTEALFHDVNVRPFWSFERDARRKLLYLNHARRLEDLRAPPGNRLESLKGKRKGQHSIRVNDRWRVCFAFKHGDAFDVEIVDYH